MNKFAVFIRSILRPSLIVVMVFLTPEAKTRRDENKSAAADSCRSSYLDETMKTGSITDLLESWVGYGD
jgi:hypothetical protein